MIRFCWSLVDIVSRVLEPGERAAVRGDLEESGETAGQALRDVFGLAVRRQAALWMRWRPWLALVGLVLPLCFISRRLADNSAIYAWLYVNNWDWALFEYAPFRHDLAHYLAMIFIEYVMLFVWSCGAGYVLASIARTSIPVTGALFGLVLLFGQPLVHLPRGRDFPWNAAVFEVEFYRMMFPLIVQVVLVLAPALLGMRQALRLKENKI